MPYRARSVLVASTVLLAISVSGCNSGSMGCTALKTCPGTPTTTSTVPPASTIALQNSIIEQLKEDGFRSDSDGAWVKDGSWVVFTGYVKGYLIVTFPDKRRVLCHTIGPNATGGIDPAAYIDNVKTQGYDAATKDQSGICEPTK